MKNYNKTWGDDQLSEIIHIDGDNVEIFYEHEDDREFVIKNAKEYFREYGKCEGTLTWSSTDGNQSIGIDSVTTTADYTITTTTSNSTWTYTTS